MRPPRLAERLARRLLPDEVATDILLDLEAEYRRRVADRPLWARLRYWAQVLTLRYVSLRRVAGRLRERAPIRYAAAASSGLLASGTAWTELKLGLRRLVARPGYALVVLTTLALSIGAATLLFSVLEGVLLRPLPYEASDRLVTVHSTNRAWRGSEHAVLRQAWDRYGTSPDLLEAWRGSSRRLELLGGYYTTAAALTGDGSAEEVPVARVQGAFFETLGIAPVLGRLPTAAELEQGAAVAVVSHGLWVRRLARDPDAVGGSITLDRRPHSVIGVMPPGFDYPSERTAVWTPLTPAFRQAAADQPLLRAMGRLARGATPSEAGAELGRLTELLAAEDPRLAEIGARVELRRDRLVEEAGTSLRLLFGAVVLVLLTSCVNLANLVLARGVRQRRELAMRSALGAGRGSLLWAGFAETLVLCLVGGVAGVLLATALIDPFAAALDAAAGGLPRADGVALNTTVLAFACAVTLLTAGVAGLGPALASARRAPADALRQGRRTGSGRRAARTQRLLVAVEAALAVVVLAGAALLARSFHRLVTVETGIDGHDVAYLEISALRDRYPDDDALAGLYRRLDTSLEALPSVRRAVPVTDLPATGGTSLVTIGPASAGADATAMRPMNTSKVSAGYFRSLGIPVLRGRGIEAGDDGGAPAVAVVNELLAERLYPGEEPLGRTLLVRTGESSPPREAEIVGVVAAVRALGPHLAAMPHAYLPLQQSPERRFMVLLSTHGRPAALLESARRSVAELDPDLVVARMGTLPAAMDALVAPSRLRTALMAALAALAVALALIGIYGIVAHLVAEQRREIGIRLALGARPGGEAGRVTRRVLVPALAGVLAGTGLGLAGARLLESVLFETAPFDPLAFGVAGMSLALLAGVSAWLPARRAAEVDPVRVLDAE